LATLHPATDCTVRGSNPGVGEFISYPFQSGPGAHPASHKMGTGSFPEVKQPKRGVHHPPASNAEVKETVDVYLYFPFWPVWPILG